MKRFHPVRIAAFGVLIMLSFSVDALAASWWYTTAQLAMARWRGTYPTAEEAMRAIIDRGYVGVSRVDILYAGPNSSHGWQPHVWYAVAEVRADRRADGSAMGLHGCDAAGSFFLQTKEGWVHVPEGAFPTLIGLWMPVFGQAGVGQRDPSTDWAPSQPARFCQSE
jgi:hypothetical protein